MKAIIGIDAGKAYKPALQLLARFRFPRPETTLAHFVNPMPLYFPTDAVESEETQQQFMKAMDNVGRDALDTAKDEACMRDLRPKCVLRYGQAADGLSNLADELHADLVAVGAEPGSLWSTSYLGSVSRSLTIGSHASILISKGPVKEAFPLKVVLATDHSAEARRWIEKFLSWRPQGIAEIHVVTAYELTPHQAEVLESSLPAIDGKADFWIEDHLRGLNSRLVAKLQEAGYKATSSVGAGKANDVIREAMQDNHGDILVIGAQGHGFIRRLFIGSCSLHQVVAEPYPVLVVRS